MNSAIFNFLKNFKIVQNYKKTNSSLFADKVFSNKKILVEFNAFHSDHIFFSYFSNVLSKKYNAQIIGFYNFKLLISKIKENLKEKLKWKIANIINHKNFGIYRSFGTTDIFKPIITKNIELIASKTHHKILKKIKRKEDIYKIKINKTFLGDLIYDTYLKCKYVPTINIREENFKHFLYEFICLFYYWENYFKNNTVKAVLGVHAHYSYAIPFRIAFKKKIPVYVHNEGKINFLNKNNQYQFSEYKYYKKIYSKFSLDQKRKCLKEGKRYILKRISGKIGAEIGSTFVSKSSFKNKSKKIVLNKNKKIKILICTQDFFDAINVYGNFHFPDFFVWLNFLGELSNITDYDWYIKDHPNYIGKYKKYQPFTSNVTKEIIKKYKNIKYLNPETKHNEIINSGIDYVITTFGSVAFEYPYFDIPVITSTKNIPTYFYNFNLKTKNKNEMKKLILSLKKKKFKFNKNEIKQFYYFYFSHFSNCNFYDKYNEFNLKTKKWDKYWSNDYYNFWMKNLSEKSHIKMLKKTEAFIDSREYYMGKFYK